MSIQFPSEELNRKFPSSGSLAFARRGEALLREERTEEALAVLEQGVKIHPGYITGFLILGRAYLETGRIEEARTGFENALRLDARCPAAHASLARLAESQGYRAECAEHLQALVNGEPWDEEFQSSYRRVRLPTPKAKPSRVAVRVDHIAEDENENSRFEEDGNGDPQGIPHVATVTLAEIYFQQGLKEQALQIYRQLLASQPENESVKKRVREIEASTQ